MFKRFCWHRWKYVYRTYEDVFLGELYEELSEAFRICEKCGKAQELRCCEWETISRPKSEILKRKIVDKGEYYILK